MQFVLFMGSIAVGIILLSYGTHIQDPYDWDFNLWQYSAIGLFGLAIILWQDMK